MQASLTIAGVPQGSLHRHWKTIHAGAEKAARDLAQQGIGVNLVWNAPLREDDREDQKKIVAAFFSKRVDGLMLAPFDSRTLVLTVEEGARAGIPTLIIDSALDSRQVVSYVGTDNKKAGALAADRMSEVLYGKGRVLVLRYQHGSASTEGREEGFTERLRRVCGISAISSEEYAGATRDTAKRAAEALLGRYSKDVQGIFTPNESSTAGTLMALQAMQLAGKIALVGFDASDTYIDSMRYKQIQGLVVQDPFRMGELGVKTLVDHLQGRAVPKRIDTGAKMITPENMDRPEVRGLLHPPTAG